MTSNAKANGEVNDMITAWMETAMNFYRDLGTTQENGFSGVGFSFPDGEAGTADGKDDDQFRTYRSWQTVVNNFSALLKLMTMPQNQEQMAQGMVTFAEALTESLGDSVENFAEFQSQLVRSFGKIGEHTKSYSFDTLDHETFESFRELYQQEFQKYYYIPKIGLPREFHEQVSMLADKTNIFHSHLHELIYMLFRPFDKTNRAMQDYLKETLDRGEFPSDSQQVYNDWIKHLEKYFMEMLQSKEYTEVLNNTIQALSSYKKVKTSVTDNFLKELQIPTGKEMDEVYREMYQMKKKIWALTRKVETLEQKLQECDPGLFSGK